MVRKILLNSSPFVFQTSNFPCLVVGTEGSGSSFFTIELALNLFNQGHKLLFFSAYPMAKEQFLQETKEKVDNVFCLQNSTQLSQAATKQAVLIMENDPSLFIKTLQELPDIRERIIVIKNLDSVDEIVVKKSLQFENLILSGDLEKSVSRNTILEKSFPTKIFFSSTSLFPSISVPKLSRYEAYIESHMGKGVIKIV